MDDLVEQLDNLRLERQNTARIYQQSNRRIKLSWEGTAVEDQVQANKQSTVSQECHKQQREPTVLWGYCVSLTNTGSTNMGPSVWLPAWAGKWLKCGIRILASYARGHGGISSGSKHQKGTNRREHLNDNTTCVAATQSNDVTTKYEYKYHTSTTSAGPRVQFISHHIQHPAADEEYIVRHIWTFVQDPSFQFMLFQFC